MPRIVLDDPGTGAITITDGSVRFELGRVVAVDGDRITIEREWEPPDEDGGAAKDRPTADIGVKEENMPSTSPDDTDNNATATVGGLDADGWRFPPMTTRPTQAVSRELLAAVDRANQDRRAARSAFFAATSHDERLAARANYIAANDALDAARMAALGSIGHTEDVAITSYGETPEAAAQTPQGRLFLVCCPRFTLEDFLAEAERRALEADEHDLGETLLVPGDVLTLVAEVRRLAAEVRRLRESAETARGEKP